MPCLVYYAALRAGVATLCWLFGEAAAGVRHPGLPQDYVPATALAKIDEKSASGSTRRGLRGTKFSMDSGRSREGGGGPVVLLSSRITSALVVLTPGEVAGLTVMIVTTSVFFPGHGALLQDAVGIGAASFLRESYDITDTRKRGRSAGTSTSYLAAGRPACCHSLPIYIMVDMFQAHTP